MLFRKASPQYVLKTIDSDASVVSQKKPSKKFSLISKITAAAAVLGLAALLGISFTPVPSTPAVQANAMTDPLCNNPSETTLPRAGNWGSSLLAGSDLPNDGDYAAMKTAAGAGQYTGFEWYSSAPLTWDYNSWDSLELEFDCRNSALAFGVLPDTLLGINNFVANLIIGFMGGVTTSNFIQAWFIDTPDSGLPLVIKNLKDSLFLNYLAPIVLLSAVGLAWTGLVKKRSRESIQGIIWMFAASAAALSFMVNPIWFAKTFDGIVTTTSNWVISSMVSASTGTAGDFCSAGYGAKDAEGDASIDDSMRTMQCNLWVSFSLIPWYAGYVGDLSGQDIQVEGSPSKFRGDTSLITNLLDAKSYPRAAVLGASTTGTQTAGGRTAQTYSVMSPTAKAEFDAHRTEVWANIKTTLEGLGGEKKLAGLTDNVKGYWSGSDTPGRTSIAISALVAQAVALFPLAILAVGMMFQQIAFLLLMAISPLFLTMGIHPGRGRKLALGWLEMVIGTGLKRIVLAAFLGLTLVYFNIVMANSGAIFFGGLDIATLAMGNPIPIILTRALVFSIGAFAILSFRKKMLKQAGDLVELNGVRTTDGGRSKALLGAVGAGLFTAGAAGVGTKMGGGSFMEGAKKGYSGPTPPGTKTVTTVNRHKQRQQGVISAEQTRAARAEAAKANSAKRAEDTAAAKVAREEELRIKEEANKALAEVAKAQEETNRLLRTSMGIEDPSAPLPLDREVSERGRSGPSRPRPTFRDVPENETALPDGSPNRRGSTENVDGQV